MIYLFIMHVSVPEEKYLTLEGFHKFTVDRAKQDIRSVWRAILACGYDLHFERLAQTSPHLSHKVCTVVCKTEHDV